MCFFIYRFDKPHENEKQIPTGSVVGHLGGRHLAEEGRKQLHRLLYGNSGMSQRPKRDVVDVVSRDPDSEKS
jgi:hypothetical protein